MGSLSQLVVASLLVALALRRAPALREPGTPRALSLAIGFLALVEVFQLPVLYRSANALLASPAGGSVVKIAFATGALGGVAAVCAGVERRSARAPWTWAAVVLLIGTLPLVLWPATTVPAQLRGTTEYFDQGWRSVVHWAPFLAFGTACMLQSIVTCGNGARVAGRGPLRMSLRVLQGACAVGLVYMASKATVLVAWHVGRHLAWWARLDQRIEPPLVALACGLVALGAGWENLARGTDQLKCAINLWRLRPLWLAVRSLTPEVVLPGGHNGQDYRLRRRVMEIRDGLRLLGEHVPPELLSTAVDRSSTSAGGEAMVVATVVRFMQAHPHWRANGRSQRAHMPLPTRTTSSIADEVAWLVQVSRSYRASRSGLE